MSARLSSPLRRVAAFACVAAAGLMAACAPGPAGPGLAPGQPAQTAPAGEAIGGTGSVRVALLLPQSAGGNAGVVARAFRNAAELAMRDFPDTGIRVTAYDTGGTAQGAEAASRRALADGSEMVLGPVFSHSVRAVAPQARQAGVPVVAFSSDLSVAGPGVYLLSFLPRNYVERIVSYSAQEGRRAFAALLPDNAYGSLVEASFRETAGRVGGRVVAVERYEANVADIRAKAERLAGQAGQFDALLVPDGGDAAGLAAEALAGVGVERGRIQLLGGSQWDDPAILNDARLAGAWFPAPAREGFEAFARRYRQAFGSAPPRRASIAYDATVLAAGLVRQFGADRFSPSVIANPIGFSGVDGVFRFTQSGGNERGLAVYEVTGSGARPVDSAPRRFPSPEA